MQCSPHMVKCISTLRPQKEPVDKSVGEVNTNESNVRQSDKCSVVSERGNPVKAVLCISNCAHFDARGLPNPWFPVLLWIVTLSHAPRIPRINAWRFPLLLPIIPPSSPHLGLPTPSDTIPSRPDVLYQNTTLTSFSPSLCNKQVG